MRSIPALLPALFLGLALFAANATSIYAHPPSYSPARPQQEIDALDFSPAKGKFLVASRKMKDPIFKSAVILLVDRNNLGYTGLIVNRPIMKLKDYNVKGPGGDDPLFFGGPVEVSNLWILVRSEGPSEGCNQVLAGVCVSTSQGLLMNNMNAGAGPQKFRVYAGYSGWAANQLERELANGGWHLVDADAEVIFAKEPGEIWNELVPAETR
ncbi:MAG TPA: hypothetical protein DDW94_09760 [Deltaproteobacteria bacterium]|nr:MAG: hypothetical protein A2Z79_12360 [Deltaproteobacteria bacterium GWA2_55_82]OGQ63963.1 MAG: hypothetical protein A3I81_07890 [Deltaproteobacteria bacterium RIFCSPLOWO2_02_FULL_55_12]OIJ73396.1 MAG: hypothetical protein A2V21_303430 [Deltaproteobacteria bacterium GWC2_55_46]HBG47256.1 hypothetical protein [Deltaproteobacteria bacterium]HCY10022.1 hypothetical protein [Deltaproteobacteria bacterium]